MSIVIGGCYVEKDDTIKISAEAKPSKDQVKLMTFDDIKVEGLDGAAIQGIELHALAGDTPTLTIHYYVNDNTSPNGGYKVLEETIHLKNFSIQSSSRMTHVEYEKKRKEILGIKQTKLDQG